jgi:adenylate cyclase
LKFISVSSAKGKICLGALIGFLSWSVIFLFYSSGLLEPYELKTYDALCRLQARRSPAPPEVALVVVDQGSLEAAQRQGVQWPWPRQMYAPIVEYCATAGARALAFDVLFDQPSSYGREDDQILAASLKGNGHGFLALFLSRENRPPASWESRIIRENGLSPQGNSSLLPPPFVSMIPPIELLAEEAAGLGNVMVLPGPDGVYREIPLLFSYRNRWLPSLGLAVYRHLYGKDPLLLQNHSLRNGNEEIPLGRGGDFLLHYYSPAKDFLRLSAFNVIQSFQVLQEGGKPIYPTHLLKDKIVFLGFTAAGLYDLKPTPLSPVSPGVLTHATFVANLIHKDFRMRISPVSSLAIALGIALAMGAAVMLIPSLWKLAVLFLGLTGAVVFFVVLSFQKGLWVDGVLLGGSLGLPFAMSTAFSYATEGRQRRQIKQMFSRYMSDLLIQDLLRNPDKLRLGGEKRVLTVFFSDLQGFTSLSEKLSPEEVVGLLNRYLTAMTDIILLSGGLIDKYEGDAIMAFWGAPVPQEDHALRACLAALDNQSRLEDLRKEFIQAGLPPIHARIGINTGEMIIGNMGSSQRFDFTVIGDSVNLASRLEGAGKEYGVGILISEETCSQAADRIEVRELDLLRVKGKDRPVRIYELLARKGELPATRAKGRDWFQRGLELYRNQKWEGAEASFREVLAFLPDDGPANTFLRRCEQFRASPPGKTWDGVYQLKTK